MDGDESQTNIEIIVENVNKLSKKVQDTNPPILTFLNDPYCLPAFHDSPIGIKEYTKNHLLELLSISLSPDLDTKTIRAYYHFCFNDNTLSFKPILENGFFTNVSEVIIQNCVNNLKKNKPKPQTSNKIYHLDDMLHSVLGRISTIAFNSFYNCPKESIGAINFLPDLLYFCYNSSVCSLFEKLLSCNQRFNEIQKWLVCKVQIQNKIADIITSYEAEQKICINNKDESNGLDNDYSFNISSMYKLLSYGLVLPNLCEYFRSELCISTIVDMINLPDIQRIRDARWYAAVCLCHPSTSEKLLPLVEVAKAILISPSTHLTQEIVNCISFISLMIKYSPIQTAKIISTPSLQYFLSIVMRSVTQFSSATSLHFPFRSFVMNCVKNSLLMPEVIHSYVPFFIEEIHNRINLISETEEKNKNLSFENTIISHSKSSSSNLLYITCWNLLYKIDEISSFSTSLPTQQNKPKPESSNLAPPESPSPQTKSKSSLFSYFSSKFQKSPKDDEKNGNSAENNEEKMANLVVVSTKNIRNELYKIEGFDSFVRNELKPYVKIIEGTYGGPLPLMIIDTQSMFVKY